MMFDSMWGADQGVARLAYGPADGSRPYVPFGPGYLDGESQGFCFSLDGKEVLLSLGVW